MKLKIILSILFSLCLIACSDSSNQPDATIPSNTPDKEDSTTSTDPSTSDNQTSSNEEDYNGYEPKNELEKKYFTYIHAFSTWTSFKHSFDHEQFLIEEDDIEQEIHILSEYVLNPIQVHQTYHAIYMRNDNVEVYANEKEAYQNYHFTEWEVLEDATSYLVDPLPIRKELYFALIDAADELYETAPNKVTFEIKEKNYDDLYELVQLAYFHNIVDRRAAAAEGLDELLEELDDIEGFSVELTSDGKNITDAFIRIYFDRADPDSVNQLIFTESFSQINKISAIDIPEEVKSAQ